MADSDHLTVTLPAEMADIVRGAVDAGDYASASEVVRAALRDWQTKRARDAGEFEALKADIAVGLADATSGRVREFDAERIVERGRTRSAARSPST